MTLLELLNLEIPLDLVVGGEGFENDIEPVKKEIVPMYACFENLETRCDQFTYTENTYSLNKSLHNSNMWVRIKSIVLLTLGAEIVITVSGKVPYKIDSNFAVKGRIDLPCSIEIPPLRTFKIESSSIISLACEIEFLP